jgi:hypothetical protein
VISQATIKKYKLDADSLKAAFTAEKLKKPIKDLIRLVADRQKEGRERNLSDYKKWAVIDMAYDTPANQETEALLHHILAGGGNEVEIFKGLEKWGLNPECLFCKGDVVNGKQQWIPNFPFFKNFTIPLVRAYLTIRQANIFNDRNTTPLFDYQPTKYNAENRVLCEILTSLVESISTNLGYAPVLREFIFNALMYSVALKFPVESWTRDFQEGSDGNRYVEKEGIRYVIPHVTKIYYDLNYPLHTLNTGTGCSYAGYWTILRYGDVAANTLLWNTDKVPYGTNWLDPAEAWNNYFKEVYPCALDFPMARNRKTETNREKMAQYYCRNDYDKAFFIGYQFMELVPKDWGLGDYENKVWMKFTIGADDVIMFAEVFGYRPIDYIGYDADSGRGRNVSLAQEIQPFQDMASNVLVQHLLTIKRNLCNTTFYNTDAIDKTQIEQMKRQTQVQYTNQIFIGFSALKMERAGNDIGKLFQQITYQPVDTSQLLSAMNTVISLLERTLVVSSQEIGAAASHQQGNKEIEIIHNSSTNRVAYTAGFVDEGVDAWKRQIPEGALCYMDGRDVEAEISADIPDLETHLKKIGFEFKNGTPNSGQKKTVVKGKLDASKLKLTQFVSRRADSDRQTDMAASQAMSAAIAAIANSQVLSGLADPESLFELVQQSAILAGADDDFKVKLNKDGVMSQQLQQTIQKIQQMLMEEVNKEVSAPVAQEFGVQDKKIEALQQALGNLQQVVLKISPSAPPAPAPVAAPAPAPIAQPPAPVAPASAPAAPPMPVKLDHTNPAHMRLAASFKHMAGNNLTKARQIAQQHGYTL